jgi:hypothetical protein
MLNAHPDITPGGAPRRGTMKYTELLTKWADEERKNGLVDIKFFPGASNQISLEDASRSVYEALTSEDWIDITNEPL